MVESCSLRDEDILKSAYYSLKFCVQFFLMANRNSLILITPFSWPAYLLFIIRRWLTGLWRDTVFLSSSLPPNNFGLWCEIENSWCALCLKKLANFHWKNNALSSINDCFELDSHLKPFGGNKLHYFTSNVASIYLGKLFHFLGDHSNLMHQPPRSHAGMEDTNFHFKVHKLLNLCS